MAYNTSRRTNDERESDIDSRGNGDERKPHGSPDDGQKGSGGQNDQDG